jgi:hypothetical protein
VQLGNLKVLALTTAVVLAVDLVAAPKLARADENFN